MAEYPKVSSSLPSHPFHPGNDLEEIFGISSRNDDPYQKRSNRLPDRKLASTKKIAVASPYESSNVPNEYPRGVRRPHSASHSKGSLSNRVRPRSSSSDRMRQEARHRSRPQTALAMSSYLDASLREGERERDSYMNGKDRIPLRDPDSVWVMERFDEIEHSLSKMQEPMRELEMKLGISADQSESTEYSQSAAGTFQDRRELSGSNILLQTENEMLDSRPRHRIEHSISGLRSSTSKRPMSAKRKPSLRPIDPPLRAVDKSNSAKQILERRNISDLPRTVDNIEFPSRLSLERRDISAIDEYRTVTPIESSSEGLFEKRRNRKHPTISTHSRAKSADSVGRRPYASPISSGSSPSKSVQKSSHSRQSSVVPCSPDTLQRQLSLPRQSLRRGSLVNVLDPQWNPDVLVPLYSACAIITSGDCDEPSLSGIDSVNIRGKNCTQEPDYKKSLPSGGTDRMQYGDEEYFIPVSPRRLSSIAVTGGEFVYTAMLNVPSLDMKDILTENLLEKDSLDIDIRSLSHRRTVSRSASPSVNSHLSGNGNDAEGRSDALKDEDRAKSPSEQEFLTTQEISPVKLESKDPSRRHRRAASIQGILESINVNSSSLQRADAPLSLTERQKEGNQGVDQNISFAVIHVDSVPSLSVPLSRPSEDVLASGRSSVSPHSYRRQSLDISSRRSAGRISSLSADSFRDLVETGLDIEEVSTATKYPSRGSEDFSVNAFVQHLPKTLIIYVNNESHLHKNIVETLDFAVTVLSGEQLVAYKVAYKVSGELIYKGDVLQELGFTFSDSQEIVSPFLSGGLFTLECRVTRFTTAGDNTIFEGSVVAVHVEKIGQQPPLLTKKGKFYLGSSGIEVGFLRASHEEKMQECMRAHSRESRTESDNILPHYMVSTFAQEGVKHIRDAAKKASIEELGMIRAMRKKADVELMESRQAHAENRLISANSYKVILNSSMLERLHLRRHRFISFRANIKDKESDIRIRGNQMKLGRDGDNPFHLVGLQRSKTQSSLFGRRVRSPALLDSTSPSFGESGDIPVKEDQFRRKSTSFGEPSRSCIADSAWEKSPSVPSPMSSNELSHILETVHLQRAQRGLPTFDPKFEFAESAELYKKGSFNILGSRSSVPVNELQNPCTENTSFSDSFRQQQISSSIDENLIVESGQSTSDQPKDSTTLSRTFSSEIRGLKFLTSLGQTRSHLQDKTDPKSLLCSSCEGHFGIVQSVAWNPVDQIFLASAGEDEKIMLWNTSRRKAQRLMVLEGHENIVYKICFNMNGELLASASADGSCKLWSIRDIRCVATLPTGKSESVYSCAWNNISTHVAYGGWDTLYYYDVHHPHEPLLRIPNAHAMSIYCCSFVPNMSHDLLVTGGDDKCIRAWDMRTGFAEIEFDHQPGWCLNTVMSSSGNEMACSFSNGTVEVREWRLNNQTQFKFSDHVGHVYGLEYTPTLILSAAQDQQLCFRNAQDGEEVYKFRAHSGPIHELSYSEKMRVLASAGSDSLIKVWNLRSKMLNIPEFAL